MISVAMFWMIFVVIGIVLLSALVYSIVKTALFEGLFMLPLIVFMYFNVFMILGGLNAEKLIDRQSIPYRIVEDPKAEYKIVVLEDGKTITLTDAKYVNNDIQVYEGTYENRFGYDSKRIIYEVVKEETTDGN